MVNYTQLKVKKEAKALISQFHLQAEEVAICLFIQLR